MSAQLPACQLLERQRKDYSTHWVITPPVDPWLVEQTVGAVSGDLGVVKTWEARGKPGYSPFALPVAPGELVSTPMERAVLFWPKAHQLGVWWLKWLCHVLPEGAVIEIVGEHQGGIKRVPAFLAEQGMSCAKLDNARRCSLFTTRTVAASNPENAWTTLAAEGLELVSHPGVFGHGKVDEGTQLLLESLESTLPSAPQRILDMGCGDGIISAWLAKRGHQITAVDVSDFAVEATKRTLTANGLTGRVLQSDVYSALTGEAFDLIISNPPFHQERDISYGPSQRLISEAPEHLRSGGRLVMVANGFLPYPDHLQRAFQDFQVLSDNRRFKVYAANNR
ncbi:methyltransferase [Vreelandella sulfidaeris]|uniref:methyltransferase n=1 Tax=Vreelandella sulfidaeris TaxID=115553 RepID=UPI0035E93725